jgi:hypothetical protein
MSDPAFQLEHYLIAESVLCSLETNLGIEFQVKGDGFTRDKMQAHVNKRAALIVARQIVLDEYERILNA